MKHLGKRKFKSEELMADAEKILEYKAMGLIDQEIKKKLDLDSRSYNARVKYIQEVDFFKNQALTACMETVHRMLHTRKLALKGYQDNKDDTKRANAAASYLKLVREIDGDIPVVAAQLGFIPKMHDTVVIADTKEFKEMSQEQLVELYKKATA